MRSKKSHFKCFTMFCGIQKTPVRLSNNISIFDFLREMFYTPYNLNLNETSQNCNKI